MTCLIRQPTSRGYWRVCKKIFEGQTICTLGPDGYWSTYINLNFFILQAVEIVGPTMEAIADFAQELRDRAPDVDGTCVSLNMCNSGVYSEVGTRDLVLECYMFQHNRILPEEEALFGPLRSARRTILDLFRPEELNSSPIKQTERNL